MESPVEDPWPCHGSMCRSHEYFVSSQNNEEVFEDRHGLLGGSEKVSWYGCASLENVVSISKDAPADAERARTPFSSHRILSSSRRRRFCSFPFIVSLYFLMLPTCG